MGRVRCRKPSTVPSERCRWVTCSSVGRVASSTAKPWFWAVISTRLVSRSSTGWFAPRWPNFSLKVLAPNAWPSSWWPRQMPKMGSLPMQAATSRHMPGSAAGSPGPLPKKAR